MADDGRSESRKRAETAPPSREEVVSAAPKGASGREVRVGVFVLAGLFSLLVLLFWLTDPGFFRGRYYVNALVPDAGGVRAGDPVQMRGVNIGRVNRFGLRDDSVRIRLEIEGEYEIPLDSRAAIVSSGPLQGMTVEIIPGESGGELPDGGTIRGEVRGGLFSGAGDVTDRANDVLGRVQDVLSRRTVSAVQESAVELNRLLSELEGTTREQRSRLRELTGSLARSAEQVESATSGPELERAVARMDSVAGELVPAAASLRRSSESLDTILGRLERGEGTLGRLSADDRLYVNMSRTFESLARLTDDIRENPERYVDFSIF